MFSRQQRMPKVLESTPRGPAWIALSAIVWVAPFTVGTASPRAEIDPLILAAHLTGEFEGGQGNYTERLGNAIAVDGDTLIAGASNGALAYGDNGGAAYIFNRHDGVWVHQASLIPSIGCAFGHFGVSVAIDGDIAVVGETQVHYPSGPGAAFVFAREGQEWREIQMLSPSDSGWGDRFGSSVAIDGDTLLVGATPSGLGGAVYVFERLGDTWTETAKFTAPVPTGDDGFGATVALSGGIALVGASGDGTPAGRAYVFRRSAPGNWSPEAQLTASDGAPGDLFGCSVSLDGNTAIIGAYGDDDHGSASGSAYVFVLEGSNWIEQAKLTAPDAAPGDYFGREVSIDGETVAIAAPYREGGGNPYGGGAYIFLRQGSSWLEQAIVEPPEPGAGTLFGSDLALKGDDLIVGAPSDDLDCANGGSLRAFVRIGETWSYTQRVSAPRNGARGHFGSAVSTSGDRLLVGAYWDVFATMREGTATVFARDGARWLFEARLGASDGEGNDEFGRSVSILGATAVVGAPDGQTGTLETGVAYVFTFAGGAWSETAKLTPSDGMGGDRFGSAVWIEADTIFIGAEYDDDVGANSGSVYVFVWDGIGWIQSQKLHASDGGVGDLFGCSLGAFGDTLLVGSHHTADYVFTRYGDVWLESAQLVPSSGWAGGPVAIWENTAIVGTPLEDDGSATIFVRAGDTWTETARLTPADPTFNDRFGFSVTVRDGLALVGANQDSSYSGAAYLFGLDGTGWAQIQRLTVADGAAYDQFGCSAVLGDNFAAIGASEDDNHWGGEAGSVYIYVPALFMDSFESGDTSAWSATVP
jgi:hypothetical protein